MAFSEALKQTIRRRAHFHCCLCHALGVEVHHIVPQSEDGADEEDNAAPLCPTCHETYGANPTKRKVIREARDLWYEICATRYASDPDRLDAISQSLTAVATRADLAKVVDEVKGMLDAVVNQETGSTLPSSTDFVGQIASATGVSTNKRCPQCGTTVGLMIGDTGRCPQCGTPW